MDQAIAATGILIDSGGTARTGADIQFTDDSTGTHSVIDINSSGSGASTGIDWTDSYNGSDAAFGVKLTLDANDGLDATAIQIVRNAGVRTVPAIDINEASTGSANVIDIDVSGVYTGDVFNIVTSAAATGNMIFVNLDSAVAGTALHIEGSGVRTQPMVELATDATGSASMVDVTLTGAISGHVFEISMDTTSTGDVLNVDMNAAVGGRFLFLDAGGGSRTANLIDVTYDSTGNLDFLELTNTNTGSGHVFDLNINGAASGNVLDVVVGAAAYTGDAISIDLGATATGSQAIVLTSGVMTRTTVLVDINENGAASGNTIDVDIGAVTYTGNVLDINLGATATGGQALVIASGAMTRTVALIEIGDAGTSSGPLIDINLTGAVTGGVIDIDTTAATTGDVINVGLGAADTGNVINIDMNLGVAATAIRLDAGNGTRTQPLMETIFDGAGTTIGGTLWDIDVTNTGAAASPLFDIDVTAVYTGNIFDVVFGNASASTGHALHVDMGTNLAGNAILIDAAGTRTAPLIYIANTGTDGGTDDHVLFINQTGLLDSNLIQLTFGTAASTGEAISIAMGTNLAGSALVINGTGTRTDDLIKIDDDSTGNSHIFDINMSGIYTGNILDITFATAAATGQAIDLNMGTNVEGMALSINSAGTGVSGEGSAIDIVHSGILVAGADVMSISATGAISSTSNALSIATIGDAGSYALYINATGSAEGIKVDAGTVTFDETLTVTGATTLSSTLAVTGAATLSSTLAYYQLTEVVTATNAIAAAETGSVFFLASATEFVSTLPAPAAGLHFTFVVTAAPSGASYTVVTNGSANIIKGTVHESSGGDADSETSGGDTVSFVDGTAVAGDMAIFWCDGTNWFVKALCDAAGAVTITTAS